jgi:hypothetical protein
MSQKGQYRTSAESPMQSNRPSFRQTRQAQAIEQVVEIGA